MMSFDPDEIQDRCERHGQLHPLADACRKIRLQGNATSLSYCRVEPCRRGLQFCAAAP
jgi:hypothetical protein